MWNHYDVYVKDIFYYMLNSINIQVNKDIYIHIYIYLKQLLLNISLIISHDLKHMQDLSLEKIHVQ